MKLLSFSAKAQWGKDTCAKIATEIAKEKGFTMGTWALAHAVKGRVYGEAGGKFSFEDVWFNKPEGLRELLQQVGTENGRKVFGETFWTLQTEAYLKVFQNSFPFIDGMVITDVRFPNEVDFVRDGGVVRSVLYKQIASKISAEMGLEEKWEKALVEEKPFERRKLVNEYFDKLDAAQANSIPQRGMALYIMSDRPTLTGKAALHESEIALDSLSKEENFDGIIYNWKTTTLDDLRRQIEPFVTQLLTP